MKILYLSSVCSQKRFECLVKKGRVVSQFQNQKFHHLLLTGLAESGSNIIQVISFPPQRRDKQILYYKEGEEETGIKYIYPGYIDRSFINPISRFITSYRCISANYMPDTTIVCNIMNYEECLAALFFRIFHKIKICAIVADVPGITSGANHNRKYGLKKWMGEITVSLLKKTNKCYDSYMFLTEAMNDVVNKRHKPYIVVEGLTDLKMSVVENSRSNKYSKKTIMYAGGLHKEYGIKWLAEAFMKIDDSNLELHIYGRGNYERELENNSRKDARIKYFGTKSNLEIVLAQTKAHLLINPRPTDAEFVKYSFPSKVMECMASGTPLLTTCLPGMPEDYFPYVYLIREETEDGLCRELKKILSLPLEEIHEKGMKAKQFVLKNKNNKVQSMKLVSLLEQMK